MSGGLFNRVQGELEAREKSPGLTMADLLTLPEHQADLLNWMMRQAEIPLVEVAAFLGQDEEQARAILTNLIQRGFVREIEMRDVTTYRVRLAPRRGRHMPLNLWQALEDKVEE